MQNFSTILLTTGYEKVVTDVFPFPLLLSLLLLSSFALSLFFTVKESRNALSLTVLLPVQIRHLRSGQ